MSKGLRRWTDKTLKKAQHKVTKTRKGVKRLTRETKGLLKEAEKTTQEVAAKVTKDVAKKAATMTGANSLIAEAAAQVHQKVAATQDMEPINFAALPDHQRVAFAGALFAMAAADSMIDKDELQLIFEVTNLEGLSAGSRRVIQSYIIEPPVFADTLAPFELAAEPLRCALILNLFEVALANDVLEREQEHLLRIAQHKLCISDAKYDAIQRFVKELRRIRLRGLDDNTAAELAKSAAAGMAAVGVPIAAVYMSGSVIGLSAAGITSGLAAVGLGLGMVPGIGMAVLLGTGIFLGVRRLLDAGQERQKERLRAEAMRKAQLVIQNLQEAINLLIDRIEGLKNAAADAEANREAIVKLSERLRALQQIIARRKETVEALR